MKLNLSIQPLVIANGKYFWTIQKTSMTKWRYLFVLIAFLGVSCSHKKNEASDENVEKNKRTVTEFLTKALPNGNLEYIKEVVSPDCITHRAGFAALYAATSDAIPQKGNFLEWVETGWKPLSEALGEQKVIIENIVGDKNTVIAQYHYSVLHKGSFVGKSATNKRVEWDEVAIIRFGADGKITDMWYMCEELKLALQLGFNLE